MHERAGQILKAVCLVLAAVLLYQLVQVALRVNPLAHVTIPALPKLASDTNAPSTDGGKGMTNSAQVSTAKGTNTPNSESGTNSITAKSKKEKGTNLVSSDLAKLDATNSVGPLTPALSPSAGARENGSPHTNESTAPTNSAAQASGQEISKSETNSTMLAAAFVNTTNLPAESLTNDLPAVSGTNITVGAPASGPASLSTNALIHAGSETGTPKPVGTNLAATGTNSAARSKSKGTNSSAPSAMAMGGMNPSAMRGGGKPAELPPEIKARVDKIYESELFGQVMRPMPMGLLGIAGNSAILRSPSGQTGLVKEGDSLGEIKLLRIGINRVLVEQDGKKTELMIFEGFGGESLMPKDKETSK